VGQIRSAADVESFYSLFGVELQNRSCRGIACLAARHLNPERVEAAESQSPPLYCLGKCYAAPANTDDLVEPQVAVRCRTPVVLQELPVGLALARAHAIGSEAVLAEIEASQLRGRGGAGFPVGRKWRAVATQKSDQKYVVANGDEGDHGSFIDKFLMERSPERVLEALAIAGFAVGASKGYVYIRKEYPAAIAALAKAIETSDLGDFAVEVVVGQGSYVCGEETALLNSIEHKRPEVRARPPYPFEAGLFAKPTLVNNVETLANVPWIVLNGGSDYAFLGSGGSRGTKAICLNSLFVNPGLYEVEFGVSLLELFYGIGGGLRQGALKAAIIGGPLAGFILPEELHTPFTFEGLQSIGASVGHGGIVAFDHHTSIPSLLRAIFEFGAFESCGKCTPCRIGSRELERMLSGREGNPQALLEAMASSSLCGHGTGLAVVAKSAFEKFPEEMAEWFA
jgi:NADH:ubiquinone oxidoreductase subunit F (NADH-binding)